MKKRLLSCLLILLALLPLSGVLYAQDLTETVTSQGITINYPAGWFVEEEDDALVVFNIEVDGNLEDLEELPPNAIGISIAPPDLMSALVEEGSDPVTAVETFLGFLDDDSEAEEVTVGSYPAARAFVDAAFLDNLEGGATLYVIDVNGALIFAVAIYGTEYSSEPEIAGQILATLLVDPEAVSAPPESPAGEPVVMGDPSVPLVYGDSVGGELTNREDEQIWMFSGAEGDVVTITMIADDLSFFDTRLYLYTLEDFDGSGDPIAENDDARNAEVSGLNSQIESFELPATGDYIIVATRLGDGVGVYTLTLAEGGLTRAERAEAATPIAYGDEVTGEISDDSATVLYTFEGSAGDVVTITMIAEDDDDLDTSLNLYTLDDYSENSFPTMSNDDALVDDMGYNSQITEFELFDDGTYIIEATRFNGEGAYTLTIENDK